MSDVGGASPRNTLSGEHAEMLATQWWTLDKFREYGVPCQDGPFALAETRLVRDAIHTYRTTNGLSEEDVEDLVLGPSPRDGFWETIAREVPGRRVRSVHDHAKDLYDPNRDSKRWSDANDSRLVELVRQNLTWAEIGDAMLRSARACRNRYNNQLVRRGTRHQGEWTAEEESRLHNIMEVMTCEEKEPGPRTKFWNQVSARMDNNRTPEQCRIKWRYSLSPAAKACPRKRWRKTDSETLFNKIALLDLDAEEDIKWDDISWNAWSTDKLRERWADLKAKAKVDASTSHRDVVQRLRGHWGDTPS